MPKRNDWTVKHEMALRLIAEGEKTTNEIYFILFGTNVKDPNQLRSAQYKLKKITDHPEWDEKYRAYLAQRVKWIVPKAVSILENQMLSSKDWLQNKAANDIVNLGKQAVFQTDDKTVTVKIEGMPDIGEPDGDD